MSPAGSARSPSALRQEPLWDRLRSAAGWTCCGWALSRAGSVAALLYAARVLGKVLYGEYATVQAAVNLLTLVAAMGLGTSAARYVSHLREQDTQRTGRIAALLLGAAVLYGLLAALILFFLPAIVRSVSGSTSFLMRLSALAVLSYSIDGVITGILSGLEKFRTIALASMVQGAVVLIATVTLTPRFGVQGAVAALVSSATLAAAVDCFLLYREVRAKRAPFLVGGALREWGVLVEFSLPTTLNSLVLSACYLVSLSWMSASSGGAAGVFGLGRQIGIWMQVVPQILLRAILPVLSIELNGERAAVSRIVLTTHALYMLSCFPVCAMVLCLMRPLLAWAAPGFRNDWFALSALIVASCFGVARGASELLLVADGRAWTNLGLSALWNAFMLGGALLTQKGASADTVSSATVVGLFLAAVLGNRLINLSGAWSPLRTDVCMFFLIAIAIASCRMDLAAVFPLFGIALFLACWQFLPPSSRSCLRDRLRWGMRSHGAAKC